MNKPDLILGQTRWIFKDLSFYSNKKIYAWGQHNMYEDELIQMGAVEDKPECDCKNHYHQVCDVCQGEPEQDEELSELKLEKLPESCTTIFDLAYATGVLKRNENKTTNHVNKLTRIVNQLQKEQKSNSLNIADHEQQIGELLEKERER